MNIQKIKNEIAVTCESVHRDLNSLKLLAVSKTHPAKVIKEAFSLGLKDFGENYVQEAIAKVEELQNLKNQGIKWHFIGHLQKNKVKFVVPNFDLIHSVDSYELAQVISKKAKELNKTQKILIEINVGSEETKGGISLDTYFEELKKISKLENIELCGLMCLPPLQNEPEQNRPYFKKMKEFLQQSQNYFNSELQSPEKAKLFCELSMGTSHDFKVAICEGSTIIRIGTALFGERGK